MPRARTRERIKLISWPRMCWLARSPPNSRISKQMLSNCTSVALATLFQNIRWHLWLAIIAWGRLLANSRLGPFAWGLSFGNRRLGTFTWDLSLRNYRLESFAHARLLENFCLGTFAQDLSLRNLRVRPFAGQPCLGTLT